MFILGILYTSLCLLLSISSSAAQDDCKTNCWELMKKKGGLGINLYNLTDSVDIHDVCSVYGPMLNCLNDPKSHCTPDEMPADPTVAKNETDFRTFIIMQREKYEKVMTRCNNTKALIELNICRRSERYKKAVAVAKCTKDPDEYAVKPHDAERIEGFCSDKLESMECRIEHARSICTPEATNLWIESTKNGYKKMIEINNLTDPIPPGCALLSVFLNESSKDDCKTNCQGFIKKKNRLGTNLYNLTDLVDIEQSCSVYREMLDCLNNPNSHCGPDEMPRDPTVGKNEYDFRTFVIMHREKYTRVMTRCNNPKVLIDLNICRRSERYKKAVAVANCTKDPDEYNSTKHDAEELAGFCSDKLAYLKCRIEQASNICTPNATNLWLESTRDGIKKLVEINKLDQQNGTTCMELLNYLDKELPEHPVPSPGTPNTPSHTPNTPSHTNSIAPSARIDFAGQSVVQPVPPNMTYPAMTSTEPTSMGINHRSKDDLVIGLATLVNLVIFSLGLLALKA